MATDTIKNNMDDTILMDIIMDNPLAITALTSLISALVGALVSGILTKTRQAADEREAYSEALKTLLKAELYDLHHRYVELDEPLDAMGMQLAAATYHVYHDALGGNGLGTKLFEQISAKNVK